MSSVALARARSGTAAALGLALVPLLSVAVGVLAVREPGHARYLVAALLATALITIAFWRPAAAVLAALAFLPFLGLVRRLLIDVAGWSGHDPLLLVGPALAGFLMLRLFLVERRPLASDRLSQLVLALALLTVVQSFNPLGGGSPLAGVAALLFSFVPLLWFFVGRELADRRTAATALALTVALAVVIALYGLAQTERGLPSWDAAWVSASGYQALSVGSATRAFGTMASAAEYAFYLAIALVVAMATVLHGRLVAFAPVPLLAWALLLESSRGIVVLSFVTVLLLLGLRIGSTRAMLAVLVLGAALTFGGVRAFEGQLRTTAASTQNPLVTHQVNGLLDPLDPKQSTLLLHWDGLVGGFRRGIESPLGHGTASTTLGGSKFGAESKATELDVSDRFVSLGLLGGLVFIAIIFTGLRRVVELYRRTRDPVAYAAAAVLFVTLGQWLNGGYYAVAPLVWLLLGWVAAESSRARETA